VQQKKAFIGWINAHLKESDAIGDITEAFSQVVPLINLLEALEKKPLKDINPHHRKPRQKHDRLEALRICIRVISARDRKNISVKYDEEALADGKNLNLCLALAWRIVVNYSINELDSKQSSTATKSFDSPEERLMHWCNSYLPENVKVQNFTTDFKSGMALVSLLNAALREEDRLSEDDIEDMEPDDLLKHILGYAEERLRIPQLLDVYHIVHSPDKQAMMTYVSLVRTAVDNREQERSKTEKMKQVFQSLEDQLRNQITFLEKELNNTKMEVEREKERCKTKDEKFNQEKNTWIQEKKMMGMKLKR